MDFSDFERYQMASLFKKASEELENAIRSGLFDNSFRFRGDAEDAADTLYRAYNILKENNK